jgi:hypothetical protein
MKTNTVLIAAALASVAIASPYIFGLLTQNTTEVITEVDLGVYRDRACTQPLSSLNWGTCYPEQNKTMTVYIKNLGTLNITVSIRTDNWVPTNAESHYILYANGDGTTLSPNDTVAITFNLYSRSTASQINAFTFDIIIQGQD